MLYRISVTERGLTGIANIFRSRLSRLDDLLGAGTVPLSRNRGTDRSTRTIFQSLFSRLFPAAHFSVMLTKCDHYFVHNELLSCHFWKPSYFPTQMWFFHQEASSDVYVT